MPAVRSRWVRMLVWPVLAAVPLWLLVMPLAASRVLSFDLAGPIEIDGNPCALRWQSSSGRENGAWLDLERYGQSEILEIRPGPAHSPGANTEFWLYHAIPLDGGREVDLGKALRQARPEDINGNWRTNEPHAGIIYSGGGDGLLRLRVPTGGISLHTAQLPQGGSVSVQYADDCRVVNTYHPDGKTLQETFHRKAWGQEPRRIAQLLPRYALQRLWLEFTYDNPQIAGPRVDTYFAGWQLSSRELAVEPLPFGTGRRGPNMLLNGTISLPPAAHAIGIASSFAAAAIIFLLLPLLGLTAVAAWERFGLAGAAFVLVAAVQFSVAEWAPLFFAPDSLDYLEKAHAITASGGLGELTPARPPGYSLLLAGSIAWFDHFATALKWIQTCMGLATAVLTYAALRPLLPRPWPAVGMLLVGLDPVLITYEHFALTETLATLYAAILGWLVVTYLTQSRAPGIAAAAILGIACGVGVYIRGNFQYVLILVPLLTATVILFRHGLLAALKGGAVALAVAAAVALPMLRQAGGLPHFNAVRAAWAWNDRALDFNQSSVFSYEEWRQLRAGSRNRTMSDFAFVENVEASAASRPAGELRSDGGELFPELLSESFSRRPWELMRLVAAAMSSQLGLWTNYGCIAWENLFWSGPMRGQLTPTGTNYLWEPGVQYMQTNAAMADIIARSRRDVRLDRDIEAVLFDQLFSGYQLLRPFIAIAFLAAIWMALCGRCWPVFSLGIIALANACLLSFVLFTPNERYSAPFKPFITMVAFYAVYRLVVADRKQESRSAGPTDAPAS